MAEPIYTGATPQFKTAEYAGVSATDHCGLCSQPISQSYFRVNEAMACLACAEQARNERARDNPASFTRALVFGALAAVVGLILYATFAIITGLIIGYVSLAVGYLVGRAVIFGSAGVTGRRYQLAAAILTYAAVSMAALPIAISQSAKQAASQKQTIEAEQRQLESEFGQQHQQPLPTRPPRPKLSPAAVLMQLAIIGLASPVLEVWQDPFHGFIGLVILAVGIRIAWRITAGRRIEILGPFSNSSPTLA